VNGPTAFFFLLQGLAPVLGMFFAYGHAYQRRVQGVSGHDLEKDLARIGFLVGAGFSFAFFWGWPEGSRSWSTMPGLSFFCVTTLGENPQQDPDYVALKLLCSAVFAAVAGVLARLNAFKLNRILVRQVPRYFRSSDPVGKR
jgi:small-conductance mechanosensitive channel